MPTYAPFHTNVVQMGLESTAGTPVAATVIWRGPGAAIENQNTINFPGKEETVGLNAPGNRSYTSRKLAGLTLPATEATYEQLPYVLEGAIKKVTASGGVGPYTRVYAPSVTATPNTLRSYTIESANATQGDGAEMAFSLVRSFSLTGAVGEAWMLGPTTWVGDERKVAAKTGSLSVAAVEEILFQKTSFYVDDGGGTIGSSQSTGTLIKAAINVSDTGVRPIFAADGSLTYSSYKVIKPTITFSITLELESGGLLVAERAAHAAETTRLIRLEAAGSGTSTMTIDMAAKYTSVGGYENNDGNTVVTLNGDVLYSSTDSLFFSVTVVNSDAAL